MTSGVNTFNYFAENRLTKFSARDAGDFSDVAGEREMAPKCVSLPRDAGDLAGLLQGRHTAYNTRKLRCIIRLDE